MIPIRSRLAGSNLGVVLDYSILDHLQRIQDRSYTGKSRVSLEKIHVASKACRIQAWIAEIAPVEMLKGIEKIGFNEGKKAKALARDRTKKTIAAEMGARILAYPCSKSGDSYSRVGMSLRSAGPEFGPANALEQKLLLIKGVSQGDARHLVCCAFPSDGAAISVRPHLDCFITEDAKLVKALRLEVLTGNLPELMHLFFGTSNEFMTEYASCC